MGVIRVHENPLAPNADSAIVVTRGVVNQAFRNWPRIVPDGAASSRVYGVGIIRNGDEHDAVDHDGRDFECVGLGGVKNPLPTQLVHVGRGDLIQAREATAGVVAIVGRPIRGHRSRGQVGVGYINDSRHGSIRGRLRASGLR